jgi:Carbohydrate binding domain (family 11)
MVNRNSTSIWQALALFVSLTLILSACQPAVQPTPTALVVETAEVNATETTTPDIEKPTSMIDTYEVQTLPSGQAGSAPIGFLTWSDGSPVVIEPVIVEPASDLALPDQTAPNTILRLETTINGGGWGGYTHAFEDPTSTTWQAQDWYPYRGISFWVRGNASGGTIFMDILDNRGPGSTADDAGPMTSPMTSQAGNTSKCPSRNFAERTLGTARPMMASR